MKHYYTDKNTGISYTLGGEMSICQTLCYRTVITKSDYGGSVILNTSELTEKGFILL